MSNISPSKKFASWDKLNRASVEEMEQWINNDKQWVVGGVVLKPKDIPFYANNEIDIDIETSLVVLKKLIAQKAGLDTSH